MNWCKMDCEVAEFGRKELRPLTRQPKGGREVHEEVPKTFQEMVLRAQMVSIGE